MGPVTAKTRIATAWLGGCSGCHMSFLDLDERLLEIAPRIQMGASPLTDFKDFPEVDVTLVEGAVANEEHLEHIQTIRKRTKILVCLGDCAVTGNVTAMRNSYDVDVVIDCAYRQNSSLVVGIPGGNAVVPKLLDRVRPVHEVVPVDYYLPGCPPGADQIYGLVASLLDGRQPSGEEKKFG